MNLAFGFKISATTAAASLRGLVDIARLNSVATARIGSPGKAVKTAEKGRSDSKGKSDNEIHLLRWDVQA